MKLYYYGHEVVRQLAYNRVDSLENLSSEIEQMKGVMRRHGLNGISAPQVGILKQLAVVKLRDGSMVELINPRISKMYGPESRGHEWCISCPPFENGCEVSRIQVVHVFSASPNNLDEIGEYKFKGNDARVVQHEIDHLEGTFFFDRANIRDRAGVLHRYEDWKLKKNIAKAVKEMNVWQPL